MFVSFPSLLYFSFHFKFFSASVLNPPPVFLFTSSLILIPDSYLSLNSTPLPCIYHPLSSFPKWLFYYIAYLFHFFHSPIFLANRLFLSPPFICLCSLPLSLHLIFLRVSPSPFCLSSRPLPSDDVLFPSCEYHVCNASLVLSLSPVSRLHHLRPDTGSSLWIAPIVRWINLQLPPPS